MTTLSSSLKPVAAPRGAFVARLIDHLVRIGEAADPRRRALARLAETNDAELAARGLTRAEAVRRIIGPSCWL